MFIVYILSTSICSHEARQSGVIENWLQRSDILKVITYRLRKNPEQSIIGFSSVRYDVWIKLIKIKYIPVTFRTRLRFT